MNYFFEFSIDLSEFFVIELQVLNHLNR